jgi:N-acetylmuramoyl-L-alanine amidase
MELRFDQLGSTRPRTEPIRGIVLHWTGGIRNPAGLFQTLRARKSPRAPHGLSVHYCIGVDGQVVQMCSHDLVCLHASGVNPWTVGIEIVNPAYPRILRKPNPVFELERRKGVKRTVYIDRIRRRDVTMLSFTPEQDWSATLLVEHLCSTLRLPRQVPTNPDGSLMRRQMTEEELASYRGVLGHYHCHLTKNDPGTMLLDSLRQRWA